MLVASEHIKKLPVKTSRSSKTVLEQYICDWILEDHLFGAHAKVAGKPD